MKPNPNWRGDPTFLPDVFRAFGVPFREYPGWKDWGMGVTVFNTPPAT